MLKESPYEILGLKDNFTLKDIKKAYRVAIRANPPEKNPEQFSKISDAYDSLVHEEYFINNCEANIFYFNLKEVEEEEKVQNEDVNLAKYLQKIFETPFQ